MKTGVITGLLVLFIVGSFVLLSSDKNKEIRRPTSGTTIVAFGDSLVVGVGATSGNNFVSLVSGQIDEPIINLGVSGDTTIKALARIDDVLQQNPRIVLVLLGGNDYLRRVPKADTFSNLEIIIESIQETGAVVVLLGVKGGVVRDEYKKDFEQLAKKHNVSYIENVLDGLIGRPERMSDSIHPNDKGYKIIADRVTPVLQRIIEG
jgi:lysophospholipase L1-like esterase